MSNSQSRRTRVRDSAVEDKSFSESLVTTVPQDLRKLMDTIDIGVGEDSWTYSSSQGNFTIKVGEMGEYKLRGQTMKGMIKSVGEKVVEEHMLGDVQVDVVREIINNQMCVCFTAKGVTAKVFYNKK